MMGVRLYAEFNSDEDKLVFLNALYGHDQLYFDQQDLDDLLDWRLAEPALPASEGYECYWLNRDEWYAKASQKVNILDTFETFGLGKLTAKSWEAVRHMGFQEVGDSTAFTDCGATQDADQIRWLLNCQCGPNVDVARIAPLVIRLSWN